MKPVAKMTSLSHGFSAKPRPLRQIFTLPSAEMNPTSVFASPEKEGTGLAHGVLDDVVVALGRVAVVHAPRHRREAGAVRALCGVICKLTGLLQVV